MRFNELKKYKDGRVVKPRDPNWKQMQDLKKSGAAGSHGDKTKEIPRKAKYKDEFTNEDVQHLTELAFLPLLIPALATAVRIGAPHVLRFLGKKGAKEIIKKGAQSGAGAAANIAKNAKPLIQKGAEAAGKGAIKVAPKIAKGAGSVAKGVGKQILKHPIKATILGVGAKIYTEVDELFDHIKELVGDMLDNETIKALAQVAVKWALPATAIIAILYGGKKLYDYIQDEDDPEAQPQEDIQDESDENAPARLLGVAQAHLGYGLEMAQHVLDGDKFKAESMARVIVDGWPDAIDKIHNVYKTRSNGESIKEFIDDRVGTVVRTIKGRRVKIIQADPKAGVYKVEFQNGDTKYMNRDELDLEHPTDALGKATKRRDWKHPWDIGEAKEKMCPEACCGVPVSECHCPPDCPHCDCNAIKEDKEKPTDKEIKQAKGIAFDKRYKDGNYTGASNTIEKLKKGLSKHPDVANALKRANEDLDSKSHKAYSSMWHKSNPIGRNWLDPDDYDADAEGTHMITDTPTEMHIYKVPAKNYDEAFDKWLDGKNSDRVQDHEFYDSTKDYSSEHQYWGRIDPSNDEMNWPDHPSNRDPEDDDWTDDDEKEFGTAARDLTNVPGREYDDDDEEEAKTLSKDKKEAFMSEEKFGVTDLEDYREKMKTLYSLERYMKSDPELADEVRRRYRELATWKVNYDKENAENYESQIYDGMKEIGETATAGSTSAGAIATVANPVIAKHKPAKKGKFGAPKAPQKKKADGTAVNALDMSNNLMGGGAVKR
jgi:hypothetical protein